jgi:chromosome segregation ATPase
MVAPSGIISTTLCVLLVAGPLSTQAFPVSRISSRANDRRGCLEHIVYALPPTENDVDTVKDQNGSGQMESLRKTLFAELEKMRKQFTEMSESLNQAKEREEKAQGTIATLKEQRQSVESEKKRAVDSKKSEFV